MGAGAANGLGGALGCRRQHRRRLVLTLPAAAAIGAAAYGLARIFGSGALGPWSSPWRSLAADRRRHWPAGWPAAGSEDF